MRNKPLTSERARELFHYAPETGMLVWKLARGTVRAGATAGCLRSDGYRRVHVDGHDYMTHRIAWLIVTGQSPKGEIDHINGVRSDNRLANLRDVSRSTNQQNRQRANGGNKLGLLGVYQRSNGKFLAEIRCGKSIHLGTFDTAEAAHAAYVEAKRSMHTGNTL